MKLAPKPLDKGAGKGTAGWDWGPGWDGYGPDDYPEYPFGKGKKGSMDEDFFGDPDAKKTSGASVGPQGVKAEPTAAGSPEAAASPESGNPSGRTWSGARCSCVSLVAH